MGPRDVFRISAALRAVSLIASTLASCPLVLYRVERQVRDDITLRWYEEAVDHPWYKPLQFAPAIGQRGQHDGDDGQGPWTDRQTAAAARP
jgi:phage portal protein BeeE